MTVSCNKSRIHVLALGALGVVFGDIGTSPLYALKESLHLRHGPVGEADILGILSLILWSLLLIVSVKYIAFIMRADHKGEGGILALVALLTADKGATRGSGKLLLPLAVFGAALLYGDGMITPAISVLSAVEGLGFAAPTLKLFVIPLTVAILTALFVFQHHGTGGIGRIFGPVMVLWFVSLALIGIWHIAASPTVLRAFNPIWGLTYLTHNGPGGFLVLGSVFLAVTGAEALYADLGHFGRKPISIAWHRLVLPSLALNYLGQGALVLRDPAAAVNPFYAAVPGWAFYPMLALATAATVIASQALISGAFSLTLQAIQLGFCPRLSIRHTSSDQCGQIYIPQVNWGLMVACIALVLGFKASSALAAAYGIAVTMTMLITTVLFIVVTRRLWHWHPVVSYSVGCIFLVIELGYFGANILKLPNGGWFALVVAAGVFLMMRTWNRGRRFLYERIRPTLLPLDLFLEDLDRSSPQRVKGCAIFLSANADMTPLALLHNLKHNKILHDTVIIFTVSTELRASIPNDDDRISVRDLGHGIFQVKALYGYLEEPNIPELVNSLSDQGVPIPENDVTYFLSRERLVKGSLHGLAPWERRIYSIQAKHGTSPADFFQLPPDRVVEIGMHIGC